MASGIFRAGFSVTNGTVSSYTHSEVPIGPADDNRKAIGFVHFRGPFGTTITGVQLGSGNDADIIDEFYVNNPGNVGTSGIASFWLPVPAGADVDLLLAFSGNVARYNAGLHTTLDDVTVGTIKRANLAFAPPALTQPQALDLTVTDVPTGAFLVAMAYAASNGTADDWTWTSPLGEVYDNSAVAPNAIGFATADEMAADDSLPITATLTTNGTDNIFDAIGMAVVFNPIVAGGTPEFASRRGQGMYGGLTGGFQMRRRDVGPYAPERRLIVPGWQMPSAHSSALRGVMANTPAFGSGGAP